MMQKSFSTLAGPGFFAESAVGVFDEASFAKVLRPRLYPGHRVLYGLRVRPEEIRLAAVVGGVQAVARLKRAGARHLHFVCLVAAPEGVRALREAHPDVPITTATIDRELDETGYIRPGLGDAGDRIFGTDR